VLCLLAQLPTPHIMWELNFEMLYTAILIILLVSSAGVRELSLIFSFKWRLLQSHLRPKEVLPLMWLGFKHGLYLKMLLILSAYLLLPPPQLLFFLTELGNLEALEKKRFCMLNNYYTDVKLYLSCSLCRQNRETLLNIFCCKRPICQNIQGKAELIITSRIIDSANA